jgi:hypothetical protein
VFQKIAIFRASTLAHFRSLYHIFFKRKGKTVFINHNQPWFQKYIDFSPIFPYSDSVQNIETCFLSAWYLPILHTAKQ